MLIRTPWRRGGFSHSEFSIVTANNWNPNVNQFGGCPSSTGPWSLGHRLVLAVPVSVLIALYLTEVARRASDLLGYLVDLLAAVPSVVYGLWVSSSVSPSSRPSGSGCPATSASSPVLAVRIGRDFATAG